MTNRTAIEWTDARWNPVTGCSKVSPGCDHCYAEALALGRLKGYAGYPGLPWTPENAATNVVLHPERLDQPLRWKKPSMVFVNSMSDLFHPRVSGDFIAQVFDVMEQCPQHVFQVLTKRPKRMSSWTHRYRQEPLPNVWLGTSIESAEYVGRADALRAASAMVRFISAEPLLGSLASLDLREIAWLIVGGESGPQHRPSKREQNHERELSEQVEQAYRRLVADRQPQPNESGAGATPGRASSSHQKGQTARQGTAPNPAL